jgi:sulfite reductase (NADPH) flavoprotein alpha-component
MGPVYVLYGTETYNSEGLAQRTTDALIAAGIQAQIADMEDVDPPQVHQFGLLLIITSTFGDGDPPSNAEALHGYLMAANTPRLDTLHYSVCGLGDSDYEQFCQCGKDFDSRLNSLGAKRIAGRADCDVDYEDAWEGWLAEVLAACQDLDFEPIDISEKPSLVGASETSDPSGVHDSTDSDQSGSINSLSIPAISGVYRQKSPIGTRKNPYFATVLDNKNLNHRQSHKETRHIAFLTSNSGMGYEVGDTLGVFPRNCPDLVRRVLSALSMSREEPVMADGHWYTIRDMLLYRKDVMVIDRRLVDLAALHSTNEAFKDLGNDKDALKAYCQSHQLIDLVESATMSVAPDAFLATLRPLAPRLYSIASSPDAHPNEIHVTVDVLRYQLHGSIRKGVASTFLGERAGPGVEVAIYLQKTRDFHLCPDHVPIIMIGPGTGIAPFRAFLQAREARGASGQSWLFFGSQHESMDFLYQSELESWLTDGLLARLDTAWSRDQKHKIYVQNRLYENGAALYRWIDAGAYIYVCGSANPMAKDVHRTLVRIIEEFGGKSRKAAEIFVDTLAQAGRYLRDVY